MNYLSIDTVPQLPKLFKVKDNQIFVDMDLLRLEFFMEKGERILLYRYMRSIVTFGILHNNDSTSFKFVIFLLSFLCAIVFSHRL